MGEDGKRKIQVNVRRIRLFPKIMIAENCWRRLLSPISRRFRQSATGVVSHKPLPGRHADGGYSYDALHPLASQGPLG
jgi:hypothetical protein